MRDVYCVDNIYISIKLNRNSIYPLVMPLLVRDDVNYIICAKDVCPTDEEWREAIKVLIRRMYYDNEHELIVDVHKINDFCAPPKEMTLDDVESELGYKVKIVDEKENT